MAFDLATAKPAGVPNWNTSGGFDLSTAKPVGETKWGGEGRLPIGQGEPPTVGGRGVSPAMFKRGVQEVAAIADLPLSIPSMVAPARNSKGR